jgi:hypothetical protein
MVNYFNAVYVRGADKDKAIKKERKAPTLKAAGANAAAKFLLKLDFFILVLEVGFDLPIFFLFI